MFAPLLSAFVIMLPLSAGEDQATITRLIAEGDVTLVETTRVHWGGDSRRIGAVASWSATDDCRSSGVLTGPYPTRFDVQWDSNSMRISQEARTVAVDVPGDEGVDQTFAFTFADSGKAGEAALAFRRLRGACTAQR